MVSRALIKKSNVASVLPVVGPADNQLNVKELALNGADERLFFVNAAGNVVWITSDQMRGSAGVVTASSVDLGAGWVRSKTFSFADASAVTTSKIIIVPKPIVDEYELDPCIFTARCAVNGTIIANISCLTGLISGVKNFNYTLG